ncbi:MAG: hypothetical protein WCB27_12335 [Thermoguttaceae bacterium]|jgi:ribosomal protein S27AE
MRPFAVAILALLVVAGPIALGVWVAVFSVPDPSQAVTAVMAIVGFWAIIGFAGYLGVSLHEKHWRQSVAKEWKSDLREYQETLEERFAASSVTCSRCGAIATPILNSLDRYRCSKCGNEFTGGKHGLVDVEEFKRLNPHPCDRSYPLMP